MSEDKSSANQAPVRLLLGSGDAGRSAFPPLRA